MSTLSARLISVIRNGLALILIGAVLLNCVNIAGRYFFNYSILSGDELQTLAMIIIAFVGAIAVSAENQQLRMDFIAQMAPPWLGRTLLALECVLTIIVCTFVAWHSAQFVLRLFATGQKSAMAQIPVWIPHASLTLAFVGIAAVSALRLAGTAFQKGADQ